MNTTFGLLNNRLTLTGPTSGEDALWLAASIPALPENARVLDVGTGIGTAALALLIRQPHLHVTGIDIDSSLITHAQTNAQANRLGLTAHTADVLTYIEKPFPIIICNPPFHAQTRGHTTASAQKSLAHTMPDNMLTTWLTTMHELLIPQGSIHLILHAGCEDELLTFTEKNLYATTLTPLQTSPNNSPKRLLAHLQKSSTHTLQKNAPLQTFNPTLREKILKNAEAL